jgi:hypothetical protein
VFAEWGKTAFQPLPHTFCPLLDRIVDFLWLVHPAESDGKAKPFSVSVLDLLDRIVDFLWLVHPAESDGKAKPFSVSVLDPLVWPHWELKNGEHCSYVQRIQGRKAIASFGFLASRRSIVDDEEFPGRNPISWPVYCALITVG